ncbi:DUF7518 family protein [Halomarina ordinaria]|uniref:BZIP transcription factor n=1 Tax=Halomarina ordinaria TaxID=3033939 RepID=A0ABD5U890_9EURY|nr:bZIP transcription factor [Halomarina sp. PSRA2]
MASGNRVEELEARVRKLEASVTGLTDELVECKERLATLEEAVAPEDDDIIEGRQVEPESEGDKAAQDNDDQSEDSGSDEIIVA